MNIFDIFRSQNPNATQKPSQMLDPMNPENRGANPQAQTTPQSTTQTPDPQTPQTPANQGQSPEVDFGKMWNIDPNVKGPADPADFKFNIDQAKIDATFGGLDFTRNISPDLINKVKAGGDDAISATLAIINSVGQQAAKTAMLASTKVMEGGFQTNGQRMKDFIPGIVREHQVSSALREANPLMKDPAYAPMVEAVNIQMARQFPTATPDEIKAQTQRYFDDMVAKIAQHGGKQVVDVSAQAKQAGLQTDFAKWDA